MRKAVALLLLFAAVPAAGAQEPSGNAAIRNVSASVPRGADCADANWPDIPARCLARVLPLAAKAARVGIAPRGGRVRRLATIPAPAAETGPRVIRGTVAEAAATVPALLFARLAFREGT